MRELIHLIYASKAVTPFNDASLLRLLQICRDHNSQNQVSGMLLHCNGSFFQILEGEEHVLRPLYNKIMNDIRHEKITIIIDETINQRAFPDWSMGFSDITAEQLQSIEGLNDFFNHATCLADIDKGRAKKLLNAFAKGHWR